MEQQKLESLLIDYIDNKLNSADRAQVEQELARNAEAYKLYEELKEVMGVIDSAGRMEPSAKLKANFESMLKHELAAAASRKTVLFRPAFYRVAAAVALLIIGGGVGFFISKRHDAELALVKAQLEENKKVMEATREMMAKLANDQSASQRIQGVNVSIRMEKAGDDIVRALVKTMNEDPNTNVRLAALGALGRFSHEPGVKAMLVASLARQKDPVVQISLIQLLVQMKEKSVVDDLKKIVDDENSMQAVKDEAYSGILRLS
jgi:HEAT repeat protein